MADTAIEVSHVWKRFHRTEIHDSLRDLVPALARRLVGRGPKREELGEGDFWALRDVSFQLKRGEVLGVIGPNGAGKSTLLKILARILKPNRGRIAVNGQLRALIEIAAGFHPDLTGRENVYLNGTILGMRRREIDKKFDEIVDFAGIEEFLDMPVKRYSSGMYARLGFAVAAHLEPEVLLVDEVLSVGDTQFQQRCHDRIHHLISQGVAIIFVSHNLPAVSSLCSTSLLLRKGSCHFLGATAETLRRYAESLVSVASSEGPVRLAECSITDISGRHCPSFAPGTRCRVSATLTVHETCRRLSCGLSVVSEGGREIVHTNTRRLNGAVDSVAEGDTLHVEGSFLVNLTGGSYTLQLSGYTYEGIPAPVFRFDVGRIVVEASTAHGGIAYVDPVLRQEIKRKDTPHPPSADGAG